MAQHTRTGWISAVLTASIVVFGCADRSPQQQVFVAIADGDLATAKRLLDDTANVSANWPSDGSGESLLSVAAAENQIEIVELLLVKGADPNLATIENQTALHTAAYHGHTAIVRVLIDAGADVSMAETRFRFTPLMNAAMRGHSDVAKLLLERGADCSAKSADGRTVADFAYGFNHLNTFEIVRCGDA